MNLRYNGHESSALVTLLGAFLAVTLLFGARRTAAEEAQHLEAAPHAGVKEYAPRAPQLLSVEVVPDGTESTAETPSADVYGARPSTVRNSETATHVVR